MSCPCKDPSDTPATSCLSKRDRPCPAVSGPPLGQDASRWLRFFKVFPRPKHFEKGALTVKLREIYATPGHKLSFEFFPPKSDEGLEQLMGQVEILRTLNPSFCSVTYGAGGGTREKTVDLVSTIRRKHGLEAMCHLTVVGQSKTEVREVLSDLRQRGIENIIALRGDPPRGVSEWSPHPDGFKYSVDLVREAKSHGSFSIAVAGFPETHPQAESPEADLQYLKAKVEAGADLIITQLFFDNDDFYGYVERVRKLGINVPIVPGIMPILSAEQATRFATQCGAKIPQKLRNRLERLTDDSDGAVQLGIEYATEQCEQLVGFGVPGIHFYSLNRSRSVSAIVKNLALDEMAAGNVT
ncbi:MAG TPA: methylenetetrahydrofolate reductase [NAD(P)H] [Chloroflexi bacterium]|nr:methylenetetrahydrofolate reductase [NAD(P)H] [Chloroflexota bacterium]